MPHYEPRLDELDNVCELRIQGIFIKTMTIGTALLLLATVQSTASTQTQPTDIKALNGDWIFVEDQTPGHVNEQLNPPMGSKFSFRTEENAVILVSGHGGARKEVQIKLDGSTTELPGTREGEVARYRGLWKNNAFAYEIDFIRKPGGQPEGLIRREFRPANNGLIVKSNLGSPFDYTYTGFYQHAEDIPLPTPAKATISNLKWLEGAWVGKRSTGSSIEERWSPAKGGAMLAISRSVNTSDKMFAFEYLRIVEREGSLIYFAQPNGALPTEFTLTEITDSRAVFDNPRHDYPKRIVYQLSTDGKLTTTIGFIKGGTPGKFEFTREQN